MTEDSPDTRDDVGIAAVMDSDDFVPPTSIEDEDAHDVVSGPNVLAEVKLPSTIRKCSFR